MTEFIHTSDTHGYFLTLPKMGKYVVHSGDLHPDCPQIGRDPLGQKKYQRDWVRSRTDTFREWLEGRPLIYCAGNHDRNTWICHDLREAGIEAYDVTNSWLDLDGTSFYGLPFIPYMDGYWKWEKTIEEMKEVFQKFHEEVVMVKGMPNILITHCPPAGVFDLAMSGQHIGNTVLADFLTYVWKDSLPSMILCGHVHEAKGIGEVFGVKVSQAATMSRILDLPEKLTPSV